MYYENSNFKKRDPILQLTLPFLASVLLSLSKELDSERYLWMAKLHYPLGCKCTPRPQPTNPDVSHSFSSMGKNHFSI
jgi:hypothetical protein